MIGRPIGCRGRKQVTETAGLNPFAYVLPTPAPAAKNLIGLGFAVDGS
jgi:hypothetical protein